ncbi:MULTISPECIES: VOC family protein [Gammaproteobacteria]|uniref:VOC family protein n=1 Tax=Gammaproteobacteria TaxID=1236 RepID=UPI0018695C00|nr:MULTISPECIES: VOC family protein [Gammaproteobacteria]
MALFSSIPQLNDLNRELPFFEENMMQFANSIGLDLTRYSTDHVSLRCHNLELATQWQIGLSQCGKCISDNVINGRPIYLFQLDTPLMILNQPISIIELPFPTHKTYEYQGWEHIEQVISIEPTELVNKVMSFLPQPLPEGIGLKISEPKGEKERLPNPTVAISNGKVTVKYHPYSLLEIVESEC